MDVRLDMELDQFRTQISEDLTDTGTPSLHAPTGITARSVSHTGLSASLADMLKDRKADHA
ncbi:hypothetical protein [Nonomuraea sp. NPDC049309]|uniref:hypothetical protein n=1 Tax=Nonomuraea sp. NPDC049309 TaxID=3364350 RepID=UPI00371319AB